MRREKRKINKFKVGIIVFIFLLFVLTTSGLGRFVYNTIRDQYLTSKQFYFTSDLLTADSRVPVYTYENWDGTGIYNFDVELFSKINDLQKLDGDQEYTIMVNFPQEVNCAINTTKFVEPELYDEKGNEIAANKLMVEKPISKTSTIQLSKQNIDEVTIYVKAISEKMVLSQGDTIDIEVTAYTSSPYKKSLSAIFRLKISTSYTIKDSKNSKYAILTVRNTSNITQYLKVDLNSSIWFDMTDHEYVYSWWRYTSGEYTGKVTGIELKMPPDTSKQIKLYKSSIGTTLNNSCVTITKSLTPKE